MKNNLDSPITTLNRVKLIKSKFILRNTYINFYKILKTYSKGLPPGKKIEIGSGGGFIKEVIPSTITSDVMKLKNCDMAFSAENMPFKNNSISCFYLMNVFHHIKNPKKALAEFQRCLKKGGKVVMVEPHNSLWSRFIYNNFHHENFNTKAGWKIEGGGHLSNANGALPWIIFVRDRNKFEKLFPNLIIKYLLPHTPLMYLLSGGLSKPQVRIQYH